MPKVIPKGLNKQQCVVASRAGMVDFLDIVIGDGGKYDKLMLLVDDAGITETTTNARMQRTCFRFRAKSYRPGKAQQERNHRVSVTTL